MWKQGVSREKIYVQLEIGRKTVYRWTNQIQIKGIRKMVRDYRSSLHRRGRKGPPAETKRKIWSLREQYRHCCGEKIQCLLDEKRSVSNIYAILREKFRLRGKNKRPQSRGHVRRGTRPREAVQVDTVDLGELYAFTAIDTYTREAHVSIHTEASSKAGAQALQELGNQFGYMEHIQRDGGTEFQGEWEKVAQTLCGNIRTSARGQKNEQAFIERFNRSLREECLGKLDYCTKDLQEVQEKVQDYLRYYNSSRPHFALNFATPSSFSPMCHLF